MLLKQQVSFKPLECDWFNKQCNAGSRFACIRHI